MFYQLSETEIWFPKPELAESDGLLAVGGDLSPERLVLAYHQGIFPWYSEETPILWYSPHERFVLFPDKLKVSSSMSKVMKSIKFNITYDESFDDVIEACASVRRQGEKGTWITSEMKTAYNSLHKLGYAHSVEVWENDTLVGGLYGVVINHVFCGESMFSKVSNASKAALIWLCRHKDFMMIDCQVHTDHLESLGAELISRQKYHTYLNKISKLP
ncbi:leucyl/phenylalanyl-tRNA--protein transferase [Daejeonella lutea]|uniref:Leucyl/phenylalanyl-tRNA--protein transferase n=1 Tax=Daejeonella lutea TaxID=572036 RepID=A0A1T5D902_9SPHI|nr:leucyl/phenylalanyl-tRNA--protein transferase [Daejeonella lutea]SKB68043.1 leucyl/phenylalanyl-tRNA--protein transferase [Daejeonella lutea]